MSLQVVLASAARASACYQRHAVECAAESIVVLQVVVRANLFENAALGLHASARTRTTRVARNLQYWMDKSLHHSKRCCERWAPITTVRLEVMLLMVL